MVSPDLRPQSLDIISPHEMLSPYFGQAQVSAEGTGAHLLAYFPMPANVSHDPRSTCLNHLTFLSLSFHFESYTIWPYSIFSPDF